MMRIASSRLVLLVGLSAVVGIAGCTTSARSYEDCILQNVTVGMEESAVTVVSRACRSKFPIPPADESAGLETPLSDEALSNVTFRQFAGGGSQILGVLYNGNAGVAITEVDISYTTLFEGQEQSYVYRTREFVTPYGTEQVRLTVLAGDDDAAWSARIVGGKGRPAQ